MKLLSIAEEAELCRAACKNLPLGTMMVHLHHEIEIEPLTEPAERRIAYILREKPEPDRALRLRLLRPATIPAEFAEASAARAEADAALAKASAAWVEADAAWEKARAALFKASAVWAEADAALFKASAVWAEEDAALAKAYAAWDKADATWDKTRAALVNASAAWVEARAASGLPHSAFCANPDCPWNGETIFGDSHHAD